MRYDQFSESTYRTSYGSIFYRHNEVDGACLVLLHGLGADSRVWSRLVECLPESTHIFALDLLGHGNSEKPRVNYTVDLQANALREFITANCRNATVLGHSYGGWIAAYYASSGLECRALVLEDAAGLESMLGELRASGTYDSYKAKLLKEVLLQNNNDNYAMSSIIANIDRGALTTQMLDSISKPTLVIWGTADNVISAKYANEFNNRIRNSKLVLIHGAGHDAHYTNAKEVADALLEFQNGIAGPE
ncbi:MAG: alpha/beta hydrolase [Candidatus Micrarchaeaceae archaeon]